MSNILVCKEVIKNDKGKVEKIVVISETGDSRVAGINDLEELIDYGFLVISKDGYELIVEENNAGVKELVKLV